MSNPATRLHELLSAVQKHTGKGTEAWTVWSDILKISKDDYPLMVNQIAKIYQLPGQIKEAIEQQPDVDHRLYLKWMPKVIDAMRSSSWNGPINQFADKIDGTVLYGLEICGDYLSRRSTERDLKVNDLNQYWGELNEMIDRILASDLDSELKRYILEHLDAIRTAIRDYRITGSRPLDAAYERVIGSIATREDLVRRMAQKPEGSDFWNKIGRLGMILSISWNVLQIGSKSYELIIDDTDTTTITERPIKNITPDIIVLNGVPIDFNSKLSIQQSSSN